MTMFSRLAAAACFVPAIGYCLPAAAQSFPSKVVTIIANTPPAGGTDLIARIYANELAKRWGSSVVVDNRPGATGLLGAEVVVRAPADGHTLLMTPDSVMAQPLFRKMQFDAARDLVAIGVAMKSPQLCFTNTMTGFKTWQDLVSYARANPGKLNYVDYPGVANHLYLRKMMKLSGITTTPVPYNGEAPGIQAVLAGTTQLFCTVFGTINQHVQAGKAIALAVTSPEPVSAFPGVPTMRSLGMDFEWSLAFVLMAPAALPRELLARLQGDMAAVQNVPEVQARISATGLIPETRAPQVTAAEWGSGAQKARDMAREFNVQPE